MKLLASVLEIVFAAKNPDMGCAYSVHMAIVTGMHSSKCKILTCCNYV
jgi:hypothetical protein